MRLLLDTHTLLWLYAGDERLSEKFKKIILDTQTKCYISMATIWELAIKIKLGKLNIGISLDTFVKEVVENGIEILPIEAKHIFQTQLFEFYHRDPFDRLLFAQAICENMNLISADTIADSYFQNEFIKRIWYIFKTKKRNTKFFSASLFCAYINPVL